MGSNQLLSTLIYFSLFHFPPTREELWYFLHKIEGKNLQKKEFDRKLGHMLSEGGFYFLDGHRKDVAIRKKRKIIGTLKLQSAKRISFFLSCIPTIKFIGITGGLAMQNADHDDDIDFFIVSSYGMIWTTRMLTSIILDIFGLRRKRADKKVANKICLNMFVDERALATPRERQDIYTAHEFVQMIPIYNKDKTYQKLFKKNSWIESFLPNAHMRYKRYTPRITSSGIFSAIITILIQIFFTEQIVKYVQRRYMRAQTKEIVTDTLLAFHPFDYRRAILKKFKMKLNRYGIV